MQRRLLPLAPKFPRSAATDLIRALHPRDADARGDYFEDVACDARRRVAIISLQGKGLAGSISPAVAMLPGLTELYLHYSELGGVIPRELGDLPELAELYLGVNSLSGSIPVELGRLGDLQVSSFIPCTDTKERGGSCNGARTMEVSAPLWLGGGRAQGSGISRGYGAASSYQRGVSGGINLVHEDLSQQVQACSGVAVEMLRDQVSSGLLFLSRTGSLWPLKTG